MSDELDRVAPRESARNKARDRKIRGPKVVSVNPGLKKLAEHIAERRRQTKKAAGREAVGESRAAQTAEA
jgi:hypothetical protein